MTSSDGPHPAATADVLPPPASGRAMMLASLAAVAGALAWGALVHFTNREFGYLAWGIGGAVGFACVKAGGYGTPLAAGAGALALASIMCGKMIAYQAVMEKEAQTYSADLSEEARSVMAADAAAWHETGDNPSRTVIVQVMRDREFEGDDVDAFVVEVAPELESFHERQPSLEEWREAVRQSVLGSYTFVDYMRDDFHPLDILFAALARSIHEIVQASA